MSDSPAPLPSSQASSQVTDQQLPGGRSALPHLGVIRVAGADAARFIHTQLTQDFALLPEGQARLAGFCNAKGRMQASFLGIKVSAEEVLLVCSADLLASTLKRLSMFVLRAQARLSDASAQYTLLGLSGTVAQASEPSPWHCRNDGPAIRVNLYPAGGVARQLWIAPSGSPLPEAPTISPELWHWGEVQSGIAMVTAASYEMFVPQMLNYESVGGVNFKKGCYPGQEVVARSQFRGTLKRRTCLMHCDDSLQAGADVFSAADLSEPAGTVAQAAPAPGGGWDALVVMQLIHLEKNALLQSSAGSPLTLLPLPYPLLEDI
jgi:tRNA-modifying protein YgfZ